MRLWPDKRRMASPKAESLEPACLAYLVRRENGESIRKLSARIPHAEVMQQLAGGRDLVLLVDVVFEEQHPEPPPNHSAEAATVACSDCHHPLHIGVCQAWCDDVRGTGQAIQVPCGCGEAPLAQPLRGVDDSEPDLATSSDDYSPHLPPPLPVCNECGYGGKGHFPNCSVGAEERRPKPIATVELGTQTIARSPRLAGDAYETAFVRLVVDDAGGITVQAAPVSTSRPGSKVSAPGEWKTLGGKS